MDKLPVIYSFRESIYIFMECQHVKCSLPTATQPASFLKQCALIPPAEGSFCMGFDISMAVDIVCDWMIRFLHYSLCNYKFPRLPPSNNVIRFNQVGTCMCYEFDEFSIGRKHLLDEIMMQIPSHLQHSGLCICGH